MSFEKPYQVIDLNEEQERLWVEYIDSFDVFDCSCHEDDKAYLELYDKFLESIDSKLGYYDTEIDEIEEW